MKRIPPPTMQERAAAARAARALRAAIADPSTRGAEQTYHVDYSRPRRAEWITTWANLTGFRRVVGTHVDGPRYEHDCLPGWTYAKAEIVAELIPDLELLAERGVRPIEATSGVAA